MTTEEHSLARWDVAGGSYHEDEAPADVDAAQDRAARRVFVAYWVVQWVGGVSIAVTVLPSLLGVPTLDPTVLIVGTILVVAVVVATRQVLLTLRRRTGVPVVADLQPVIAPLASYLAHFQQLSREVREIGEAQDSFRARARARQDAEGRRRAVARATRKITECCEIAAYLAHRDWPGARWVYRRQLLTIFKFCVRLGVVELPEQDTSSERREESNPNS